MTENKKETILPEGYETFFDLAAEMDFTKHMGSAKSTKELIDLCHINKETHVLDIGCGVGQTPCYLAKRVGCRVVGIDINARMVERAKERAKRMRVEDNVEFRIADAQELPFDDNVFDVVITESVIAMVEDKQRAISECMRVIKPGGYVGLNETTLLKASPPTEIVEFMANSTPGAHVESLNAEDWEELLAGPGLRDIIVKTYEVKARSEGSSMLKRYGLKHMVKTIFRMLALYKRSPSYRQFAKEAGSAPREMAEYYGYGIYVGRK
ncbi:MAG: class I SAM-dependent methyltransferase [Promethearchaeota archaeon]